MKQFWQQYFTFTKKERRSVIILLILIGIAAALPYLIPKRPLDVQVLMLAGDSIIVGDQITNNERKEYAERLHSNLTPFRFDPNELDEAGFLKMGMRPGLIKTILKYRSKGGRFYTAEDLRKIYTLKKEEADILIPYVSINNDRVEKPLTHPSPFQRETLSGPLDINTASIEEIRKLPGLPTGVAYKILNYREAIGGFTSLEQIKKTYGMNDSIYRSILPWLRSIEKRSKLININTAFEKQLISAGIEPQISKAIIIYRQQQGHFRSVSELRNIVFITPAIFERIAPLLTVE